MKRTKEDYSSFNLFSIVGTWESVNLNPTVIIYRSDKEYLFSIIYVSETTKQASPATYEIQQDGILGCSVNKWRSLGNVKDGSLTQWTESEGFKALVELLFEGRDTSIDLPCKHCPNLVKVLSCPLSIEGLQKYNEYIAPALR